VYICTHEEFMRMTTFFLRKQYLIERPALL
jgi:hypothetical protein